METAEDNQSYCLNMVRKDDPDRYLTVLFAPSDKRRDLFALYAFNQEVAKTRESVSEAMIGEIRLQWWKEAIDQILSGHTREHPVVQELAQIKTLKPIAPLLYDIIEARKSDLYTDGVADMKALTAYAENVGGKLCEAAVIICNETDENSLAGLDCGTAWAMIGLIRAIPFHNDPANQILSFGFDHTERELDQKMKPMIKELADNAQARLDNLGKNASSLKDKSPLLLSALSKQYLKQLNKSDYTISEFVENEPGTASKIANMTWCAITRGF
jgi:phytoene synthase